MQTALLQLASVLAEREITVRITLRNSLQKVNQLKSLNRYTNLVMETDLPIYKVMENLLFNY